MTAFRPGYAAARTLRDRMPVPGPLDRMQHVAGGVDVAVEDETAAVHPVPQRLVHACVSRGVAHTSRPDADPVQGRRPRGRAGATELAGGAGQGFGVREGQGGGQEDPRRASGPQPHDASRRPRDADAEPRLPSSRTARQPVAAGLGADRTAGKGVRAARDGSGSGRLHKRDSLIPVETPVMHGGNRPRDR